MWRQPARSSFVPNVAAKGSHRTRFGTVCINATRRPIPVRRWRVRPPPQPRLRPPTSGTGSGEACAGSGGGRAGRWLLRVAIAVLGVGEAATWLERHASSLKAEQPGEGFGGPDAPPPHRLTGGRLYRGAAGAATLPVEGNFNRIIRNLLSAAPKDQDSVARSPSLWLTFMDVHDDILPAPASDVGERYRPHLVFDQARGHLVKLGRV